MLLHQLPKTTLNSKKRQGQGYGSGKGGHTSGRGQKGQRSRTNINQWFEGGQLPQIRRFPFIRGKSRFVSLLPQLIEINVSQLNSLPQNTIVTPKTLLDHGLIKAKDLKLRRIKILGRGHLSTPLTIELPTSERASAKIVQAGGKVIGGQSQ